MRHRSPRNSGVCYASKKKHSKLVQQEGQSSHCWGGDGPVARWSWVNFQCQGVLLSWISVGQGSTVLAVGAGGGCLDIITLINHFSFFSLSLGDGPI